MPVSNQQLAAFADTHAWRIPFDTSPRHLAGPGDARHVTHGLAAAGWRRTSEPFSPTLVLTDPDQRYNLHFDPQSAASSWWQLQATSTDTEPGWYASFGELVPAEILASVTDILIAPKPAEERDPLRTLHSANWTTDTANTAHSPDGACHLEHHVVDGHGTSWSIEVCEPGHSTPWGRHLWRAHFGSRTPVHLVGAFVAALADTAPLQRGMHDRTAHYSTVQQPSQLTPQQVVAAHASRLDVIRAQARAARRQQQTPTTAQAPVTSPAARPTARRRS
ncbi:DUF317 domain-containing protein [Streptomyces prunicolor]|uniref:DUF317 domain-containing protein n=1 Tax=Streptomyces prunicolor TaxID=67348 RepID=UPI0033CA9EC4